MRTHRRTARAVALACVAFLLVVCVVEALPHQHASAADRGCPACQAARQHLGDAPRGAGVVFSAPSSPRPQPAELALERFAGAPAVPSAPPRAPPSAA